MSVRWPRLQLEYHPVLDRVVVQYTPAFLLDMADAISKNPHPIQTKTATGAPGVWDPAIEALLRSLADKPAALKVLNHRRFDVVPLNRAVHFHIGVALHPLRKKLAIRKDIATVWGGISEGQVKDDVTSFPDAARLTEQLIAVALHKVGCTREDALSLIDADMRDRAAQLNN